ncbi:MAG: hypothetical protein IPK59_03495 [Rhodospirillaceae bacterium]|nr:hypothetical protein [Rhodospirillaceae bacterium]
MADHGGQLAAQIVGLVDLGAVEVGHGDADTVLDADQTVGGQALQGLAYRRAAEAEFVGKVGFAETHPRRMGAGGDALAELLIDLGRGHAGARLDAGIGRGMAPAIARRLAAFSPAGFGFCHGIGRPYLEMEGVTSCL